MPLKGPNRIKALMASGASSAEEELELNHAAALPLLTPKADTILYSVSIMRHDRPKGLSLSSLPDALDQFLIPIGGLAPFRERQST